MRETYYSFSAKEMLTTVIVFMAVTCSQCDNKPTKKKSIRYVESSQREMEMEDSENPIELIDTPDFGYPEIKVLPVGFVLILRNYSLFEKNITYTLLKYKGFKNFKINLFDPEARKDISGNYVKAGNDYMAVNNVTVLMDNDYLQIITEIDYVDRKELAYEEERMNGYIIHDPRNGTPPYGEIFVTPQYLPAQPFDRNFLETFFGTTTSRVYEIPERGE